MQKIAYRIPWQKEHNQNRFHSASFLVGHLQLFEVGPIEFPQFLSFNYSYESRARLPTAA